MQKYNFRKSDRKLDKFINPESWPNALFLPIIQALYEKKRIVSINVPYTHRPEQTASEQDSEEYRKKRDEQYKNIILTTIHFIKFLEKNSRSRLSPSL